MKNASITEETHPLSASEFGIISGGDIEIVNNKASLTFRRLGDHIEMHLSLVLTFKEDYISETGKGNIAIGKQDIKFPEFGKFTFDKESFLNGGGAFQELFLFVDPDNDGSDDKYKGIILKSNNNDFMMKTTAIKIEHGTGLISQENGSY
jgi:hypothetical protein